MTDWVELTRISGEVDANVVAGSLENEGIPTRVEKTAGVWRYGASDAFVVMAIYVPDDRAAEAKELLARLSASGSEQGQTAAEDGGADPFVRSRGLRWWVALLILVGLLVAFLQSEVLELLR